MKPFTRMLVASGLLTFTTGASCLTQKNAKSVLDIAQMACVLFHDDIEDVKVLATLCNVAEGDYPEVNKILLARKSAAAQKAAAQKGKPSPSSSGSAP